MDYYYNLLDKKFGIRVGLLFADGEEFQDRWREDRRLYTALKWRITNRTTINANFEKMTLFRNAPTSVYFLDRADVWRSGGSPIVNNGNSNPNNLSAYVRNFTGSRELPQENAEIFMLLTLTLPGSRFSMRTGPSKRNSGSSIHFYTP